MSTTALTPQVPPKWRITSVGLAMLLMLTAIALLAVLHLSTPVPDTPQWSSLQALSHASHGEKTSSAELARALEQRVGWLTHATWTFTCIALLLAVAQRSLQDMALAGAGALWALLFELGGRAMKAPDFRPPAFQAGLQTLFVAALALSLWHGLRLLRRSGWQPYPLPLSRLLLISSSAALLLGLNGTLKEPLYWVLPIAGLLACCGALVRMVDMARRPGSALRPSVSAWLLAAAVALATAAGCRELWLRATDLPSPEVLRDAWFITRGSVVLVLVCALGLRLDQLARMMRQLGSSHGHWRRRLRDVQRHLAQARERVALGDRTQGAWAQRDHLLRELHDDLGHRLLAALSTAEALPEHHARALQRQLEGSLVELRLAHDALGRVPRPLMEALQRLQEHLAPMLEASGKALRWAVDGPAHTLVLDAAQTLQLLRLVRGALDTALQPADAPAGSQGICKLLLDVADGETGRHLRLRVSDEPAPGATAAHLGGEWIRLQRQATSLGAQLALDPQAGPLRNGWAIELVMPLTGR